MTTGLEAFIEKTKLWKSSLRQMTYVELFRLEWVRRVSTLSSECTRERGVERTRYVVPATCDVPSRRSFDAKSETVDSRNRDASLENAGTPTANSMADSTMPVDESP